MTAPKRRRFPPSHADAARGCISDYGTYRVYDTRHPKTPILLRDAFRPFVVAFVPPSGVLVVILRHARLDRARDVARNRADASAVPTI